jgi:hypothetical protein
MSDLKEYVEAEMAANEKRRQEYMDEKGYNPFIKWEQGVTEFKLLAIIPRDHESFGNLKKAFTIEVGGEMFDWSVNPRSPMYQELLPHLLKAPVDLKINRLGEGLETRYSLL